MLHRFQAVYESGVLRPLDPLPLDEHRLVSVVVLDNPMYDDALEFEAPGHFEALADKSVTLEALRKALSKIPGSLDADFLAERDER